MAAAVLLPTSLVALSAEGLLLAEAGGVQAIGGDAQRLEILLDSVGSANAEAEVVFGGAALVAVAFNDDFNRGVLLQEVCSCGQRSARVRANVSLVVVEVGVTDFLVEIGLGCWRRRRRWWSGHVHGSGGACRAAGTSRRDCVGRGVGRRNFGGALCSDGANVRSDGELRSIGGIPAQCR